MLPLHGHSLVAHVDVWFWRASKAETCRAVVVPELDFDAIMELRARKSAYQRSNELTPWLIVSPEEMTFLLAQNQGVSIAMEAYNASELKMQIGYPVDDGCYNIDLIGAVNVKDGALSVSPRRLSVGGYDLSWLVGLTDIEMTPQDIPDKNVAAQLENTRALTVQDGHLHLRLKERTLRWRFNDE